MYFVVYGLGLIEMFPDTVTNLPFNLRLSLYLMVLKESDRHVKLLCRYWHQLGMHSADLIGIRSFVFLNAPQYYRSVANRGIVNEATSVSKLYQ